MSNLLEVLTVFGFLVLLIVVCFFNSPNKKQSPNKHEDTSVLIDKAKESKESKESKSIDKTSMSYKLCATMNGIAAVESSGSKNPYRLLSKASKNGDRAHGKYQIMGNNIGPWSKAAIGRSLSKQEFLDSPQLQEKVAAYIIGGYLKKHSPQDAASMWFSGRTMAKAGNAKDVYGTTVPMYIKKFNANYKCSR